MKRIIGISMIVSVVAIAVWSFTSAPMSVADEPTAVQTPPVVQKPPAPVAATPTPPQPAGPSILYFAPVENRNLAVDEGMIGFRRNGVEVTYVTEQNQFVTSLLDSTWQAVIVVDISEEVLPSDVLTAYPSALDPLIIRMHTLGALATHADRASLFVPSALEPNGPRTMVETMMVSIGCLLEFTECRSWCIWKTPPFSDARRSCDSYCNCCLATCEQGHPCSQNGSSSHPCGVAPWAPKQTATQVELALPLNPEVAEP